jgi:hypothetical protein
MDRGVIRSVDAPRTVAGAANAQARSPAAGAKVGERPTVRPAGPVSCGRIEMSFAVATSPAD